MQLLTTSDWHTHLSCNLARKGVVKSRKASLTGSVSPEQPRPVVGLLGQTGSAARVRIVKSADSLGALAHRRLIGAEDPCLTAIATLMGCNDGVS